MKPRLDMEKIASALGAERRGKVKAGAGYFGALQLLAEIESRLQVPDGGGRPTDPRWTEKRLVGMSPGTLKRLQEIAKRIAKAKRIHLNAMQVAAILIEKSIDAVDASFDIPDDVIDALPKKKAVGHND